MLIISLLLIGYSIFSALVVVLTHFQVTNYEAQAQSRLAGMVLLFLLVALQLSHLIYLNNLLGPGSSDVVHSPVYRVLLFSVAPVFYLYSQPLLQVKPAFRNLRLLHFLPSLLAAWLSFELALPMAFFVGALYLLWLIRLVYTLRQQRFRFRFEISLLLSVFLLAMLVSVMGMGISYIGETVFFNLYSIAIGGALLLVNVVLGYKPQLAEQVAEAVREAYVVSTLGNIDCDTKLENLEKLMSQQAVYQDPSIDLTALAEQVDMTSHQLSELINTRLGKNFPRYLREYRIEAAKKMLLDEPSSSVLSVGMSVGFTSQSSFYDAFREITGMTPGKYRTVCSNKSPA